MWISLDPYIFHSFSFSWTTFSTYNKKIFNIKMCNKKKTCQWYRSRLLSLTVSTHIYKLKIFKNECLIFWRSLWLVLFYLVKASTLETPPPPKKKKKKKKKKGA